MTLDEIIAEALKEDLGDGDHSSLATIPKNAKGKAQLLVKENGIIAGINLAKKIFKTIDSTLIFKKFLDDGAKVKIGDIAFEIEGSSISILSAERLVLNFMQRMSGIATKTAELVSSLKGLNVKLLDTRKTTPLLREIEKYAVKIGGGENHRFGLYDVIMIKDNHIDFSGGIQKAILATQSYLKSINRNLKIEIEVRNLKELNEVLNCGGVDRIMLDNFSIAKMRKAVELVAGKCETEASGGITETSIRSYAETGVDYISVGALTHHIKSLDLSLKAKK
ncbi:MAG: nicotinate-nucleotide diphosphorylase (carboxylating) [Bacteroidetes bacterium CG2_30_33_31]|nr:MAG: nicotinate-nucleotide diphosphorylase (carboxylating) [Bacteroidetes bacterium CG2_30_33_31]